MSVELTYTKKIADECITCGACKGACSYLATWVGVPKARAVPYLDGAYASEVHVPFMCNLCGLCAQMCPKDLDTGKMMQEVRERIVEEGLPLPGYVPMISENHGPDIAKENLLVIPAPSGTIKRFFFPGCNLQGYSPEVTLECAKALQRRDQDLGILITCCGAPILDGGDRDAFQGAMDNVRAAMDEAGAIELVVACSNCAKHFHDNSDIPVVSAYEILARDWGSFEGEQTDPTAVLDEEILASFVLQDPCKSRDFPELQQSVRDLLEAAGFSFRELKRSRARAKCCGQGGMVAYSNYEWADKLGQDLAAQIEGTQLTYCATCRKALGYWGTQGFHILDLLFRDPEELPQVMAAAAEEPDARAANRARSKELLSELAPGWSASA